MMRHERVGLVAAGVGAAAVAVAVGRTRRRRPGAASPGRAGMSHQPELNDRPVPRSVAALQAPAPQAD